MAGPLGWQLRQDQVELYCGLWRASDGYGHRKRVIKKRSRHQGVITSAGLCFVIFLPPIVCGKRPIRGQLAGGDGGTLVSFQGLPAFPYLCSILAESPIRITGSMNQGGRLGNN